MTINWTKYLCSSLSGLMAGRLAGAPGGNRPGRGTSVPRSAPEVRPVICNLVQALAFLAIFFAANLLPQPAISATNGDKIINRATFTSVEFPAVSTAVTVSIATRTPSTVEFLKYAPGMAGATSLPVATTDYFNGSTGSFNTLPPPNTVGTPTPIDLTSPVPLLPYSMFHAGEPVFIRVTDLDQNLDRSKAETIIVSVTDSKTGDTEILRLSESGPDSGVFIGYIQSSPAAGVTKNGALSVVEDSSIDANYTDIFDGSDSSANAALVDPFGLVFDTVTGKPIDGATVELLNADGTPASVLGDNGLATNSYPNSVVSGGTAKDAEGNTYTFSPGGYRFPYVAPGSYILRTTPPISHTSPSTVSTVKIQTLPGAPYAIQPGSRGETFPVPAGPAIRVDLPLDPKVGTLWLSKSASRSIVSAGEFLGYDISLENTDPVGTVFAAVITDKLPPGFRYQKGSARINNAAITDPAVSTDGSTLTFAVGTIGPKASATIRYIAAVGAGASQGQAINTATAATTPPISTNIAQASVQVLEPFMQSRTLIMGRVIVGACSDNIEESKKGMEGIGIYLEDGAFVISDKLGMFHLEGVRPGSHVVQLDLDSIPEGYKIQPCEQNSRFAGRAYSQFVDLQGGSMWRTDFYLRKTELTPPDTAQINENGQSAGRSSEANAAPAAGEKMATTATDPYQGEIALEMISSQSGDYIDYRIPLQTAAVPLTNLRLTITLPPGAGYVKGSSSLDGAAIPDPAVIAYRILEYQLGAAGADSQKELRLRIIIDKKARGGELQTKADLTFDGPLTKDIKTPAVDNLLSLVKEESRLALPTITVRPQFPTFGAELSTEDRKQLDELAQMLSRFKIDHIDVAGHTDTVRIAPRSRNIYADNTALSFARARSVGRYLTAALHLPPESLNLSGSGEREPIASNRTAAGRTLNRRVEVKVSAGQTVATTNLRITKERSGQKKQGTTGGALQQNGGQLQSLSPLQPGTESLAFQSADNASDTAIAAENSPPADSQQPKPPETGSAPKKSAVTAAAKNEELLELFSALSEGLVHYRIKMSGVKEPLKKVTATLVTPKSQLYITGTSRLSGLPAADPETKEAVIAYNIATLPDEKKFDLRLQTLIDGDDQAEALSSSVTVVISDADGKPLKTLTATAELSDNMEDLNRPDTPPAAENSATSASMEKNASEDINEFAEKVSKKANSEKSETANAYAGLHVMETEGILTPADGTMLATQINAVRLVLNSTLTPVLTLDGKVIPSERIGFKMKDRESDKSIYTYIGIDFGDAGEHILQLKGMDTFGVARFDKSAKITRTGEITSIKIVAVDGNIADGRTPVTVRIQMFDKDDKPVMASAELALKGGELRPLSTSGNAGRDSGSGMVSVDSQGWINFQPVTASGLYRTQLAYNRAIIDIETYVKPKMRDWILVGIAEGTAGYNTVSGHTENLKAAGEDEHFYDKERLAFYAKGTIKGEWLLTMAYDSAKKSAGVNGNALFQNIDPNAYYTLYGDNTTQGYEAASQKKLYLKVERDQFYAMYGDYDTGLTVTELSRYSRRLNGIKTEFRSRDFELTAFGSETGQSFVKDELRGDGTSGLYRLSKTGLVLNSEKITIESRDRFHSETVTDSRPMTRFIDYSIDYASGAIFFKGPVPNRDEKLNPVYIVVDYEIADAGKNALTYGGRAGTRLLNGKLQVGGSYIHEGHISGSNNLYGADAAMVLGPGTSARAEIATTNSDTSIMKASGNAYLAEITHTGKALDGKAYYREQDSGYGLGQQKGSEAGTRKYGAEGAYRLNRDITLSSQAYRQYNLTDGSYRDFVEGLGTYTHKQLSARTGLRYANDTLADGSNKTSIIGTAGASWRTFDQRLTLRADHDQALFNNDKNTDFPTRTIVGADYQATKAVLLFAQEELTYGAAENTNTTRVGVKATPWSGGTVASSVVNDMRENSERTFATVGLAQKWQIDPRWTVDGGLDHTRTLQKKTGYQLSATVPPASGGDDFTAVSLGANYQEKRLTWSNRAEYRNSDSEDKWGLMTGLVNEQGLNWGWTSRLQLLHSQSTGGSSNTGVDLRLGLAYRPPVTRWIILDRLDLIAADAKSNSLTTKGRRIINNLNANYKPDKKTQVSLQYGAKYVQEKIDDNDYNSFTDLIGFEGRYDLTKEWDIGLRGAILHSWKLNQYAYSIGPSVGYNMMDNAWLSLGYNVRGFHDDDFSAANFTAQGPFVQFRFKFDQNSVKDGLKALNQ